MAFPLVNGTDMAGIAVYMNTVTNNMFWAFLVLGIFIIMFIILKDFETGKAFLASSFITTIFSLMLRWANLVSDMVVFISIISVVGGFVGIWLSANSK